MGRAQPRVTVSAQPPGIKRRLLIGTYPSARIVEATRRPLPVVRGRPSRSRRLCVLIASMPRTKVSTFSRRGSASRSAASAFARCSCSRKDDMALIRSFLPGRSVHNDHSSELVLIGYWVANRSCIVRRGALPFEKCECCAGGGEHWMTAHKPAPNAATFSPIQAAPLPHGVLQRISEISEVSENPIPHPTPAFPKTSNRSGKCYSYLNVDVLRTEVGLSLTSPTSLTSATSATSPALRAFVCFALVGCARSLAALNRSGKESSLLA